MEHNSNVEQYVILRVIIISMQPAKCVSIRRGLRYVGDLSGDKLEISPRVGDPGEVVRQPGVATPRPSRHQLLVFSESTNY